jgi:hypothetical protein
VFQRDSDLTSGSFFIQIATRQSEAQLTAECPMCGAMTTVPLAYAFHLRSVACCECGTKMTVGPEVISHLKTQAMNAVAEIERLISTPRP